MNIIKFLSLVILLAMISASGFAVIEVWQKLAIESPKINANGSVQINASELACFLLLILHLVAGVVSVLITQENIEKE